MSEQTKPLALRLADAEQERGFADQEIPPEESF